MAQNKFYFMVITLVIIFIIIINLLYLSELVYCEYKRTDIYFGSGIRLLLLLFTNSVQRNKIITMMHQQYVVHRLKGEYHLR